MKKSNVIVLAVFAACSVVLLCLWYFLGFHRIDSPLDLIVSIVWWAVIALVAYLIVRAEKKRRLHVRTVYVSDTHLFNSELGLVALEEGQKLHDALADMIESLEYSFRSYDFPSDDHFNPRFMVRTFNYKPRQQQRSGNGKLAGDGEPELAAAGTGFGGMAMGALDGAAPNGGATVYGMASAAASGKGYGSGGSAASDQCRQEQWEGEVVMARGGGSTEFDTPERLRGILRSLHRAAG